MDIYALPNYYYDRVNLDTNVIDGVEFTTLDEYLYKFPLNKRLVTAYVKRTEYVIDISYIHELFCDFDKIGFFGSEVHHERMESNNLYRFITERYVKNPIIWTTSTQRVQSHYFDSKYLKIGKFQKIARKNSHQYFNMQSTSNVINFSKVRTLQNMNEHNNYFLKRFKLEGDLRRFVKKHIGSEYTVITYDQTIEIRIEDRNATVQIVFTKWDAKLYLIWGQGIGARKISESFNDIYPTLREHLQIIDFYSSINGVGDGVGGGFIKNYIKELDLLKSEYKHTINLMVGNIKYSIMELFKDIKDTYYTRNLNAYAIHNGLTERIHVVRSSSVIRIYRHINFNTDNEIVYCSYSIGGNITNVATRLFNMGVINFSLGDHIDDNFDYGLLAKGMLQDFALSFMKVTTTEASKMFSDYEKFGEELDLEILENPNPKDTRVFKNYNDIPENTYFELLSYKANRVKHIEEKNRKQRAKYLTVKQFINEYKKDLEYFT